MLPVNVHCPIPEAEDGHLEPLPLTPLPVSLCLVLVPASASSGQSRQVLPEVKVRHLPMIAMPGSCLPSFAFAALLRSGQLLVPLCSRPSTPAHELVDVDKIRNSAGSRALASFLLVLMLRLVFNTKTTPVQPAAPDLASGTIG